SVSSTPTKAKVQLINSQNSSNVFFVKDITEIDCTQTPGVANWSVPEVDDYTAFYSLQIILSPKLSYSGQFHILPPGGAPVPAPSATGPSDAKPTSGAGSVVPALTSAVLAAGAAAFYML
ncbi:hypothetical protein BGZ76_011117, partial [Entomortierella beljakovae]